MLGLDRDVFVRARRARSDNDIRIVGDLEETRAANVKIQDLN